MSVAARLALGAPLVVSGAVASAAQEPYTIDDMVEVSISSGYALVLAEKCPMVTYTAIRGEEVMRDMLADLNAQGMDNASIGREVEERGRQAPEDTSRFMDAEGIDFEDQESWCQAAFRHIRDDTQIGLYLQPEEVLQ